MLPNITGTPTYNDYLNLCWQFVGREAKLSAKDAFIGRSSKAAPVNPKPKAHGTAPAPSRNSAAAGFAQWETGFSHQGNPQLAVSPSRQGDKRVDPDFKISKEISGSMRHHPSLLNPLSLILNASKTLYKTL